MVQATSLTAPFLIKIRSIESCKLGLTIYINVDCKRIRCLPAMIGTCNHFQYVDLSGDKDEVVRGKSQCFIINKFALQVP